MDTVHEPTAAHNADRTNGAHPFAAVFGVSVRPDPVDRAGQVGRICGITAMLVGSSHPLILLLRAAERDDKALGRALGFIEALPTLTRRKLIATFGATQWARAPLPDDGEPVGKFTDIPANDDGRHD